MARLIGAFDWSTTALGPIATWPQSLKTATGTLLLSPVPIVLLWGEAGYMIYNDAYSRFAGARHPSLLGSEVREGWREVADFNDNIMKVCLSGGTLVYAGRELLLDRTGTPEQLWADLYYSPVLSEEGRPAGVLAIVVEITERVLADRRVALERDRLEQRVEERTRALADSMNFTRLALSAVGGVGVWTYDLVSERFFCDVAIAALYDIDPIEGASGISRERFLQNVHPEDVPKVHTVMSGAALKPGDLELEYRLKHRDGSTHWVLSRAHTYVDDLGRPIRRTGVGVETTKQRVMEEQFRQAQKMEAVGQLTGGLAHDFNNLLAGISGSIEVIRALVAQGKIESLERYITAALGATKRAAALTHRLLAFSRRQTLDPKPTDVNRLVQEMEELIRRTVGPQITLEVVGAGGLWPTLVDPNQLENALLNLCINARDAMPDGGRITIETANKWLDERAATERDLPPGQYISLCVTDTGTGMTPEIKARAFDPFFTTKPIGEGTGLGLSMIYGFARQSGGQVRIYSEVSVGTTMCLYLPRHSQAPEPVSLLRESAPQSIGSGQTVLVVDDEPTVRMLIADVLEAAGYVGLEAINGASALEQLRAREGIALLVTDVGLPGGLNGRQLADAARVLHPGLKVLFITGYAENAVVGSGRRIEPGMELLTKPFDMEDLARRIRHLIEG